jgi:hypothetical protein
MPSWRPWPALVAPAALLLLACSHGEPFGPTGHSSSEPLEPAIVPLRLTYGGGQNPAWLPDGTRFIYSYQSAEHSNGPGSADTCLGILPASGGRRTASICNQSPFEAETLDVYTQPAPAPEGDRIALLRGALNPISRSGLTSLVMSRLDSLPFGPALANDGFPGLHGQVLGIGSLRWAGTDKLIFLGADNGIISPCDNCNPIVIGRWRDAYLLSVDAGTGPQAVAGTEFATSIAVASSADMFITFANDDRVLHHDLTSGATTLVAVLAPGMTPRDADYSNGRIVVVAGGKLEHFIDDDGNPAQGNDQGGELQLVDPLTGTVTPLHNSTLFFRHPRLSPDGTSIIAEGYRYQIVADPNVVAALDTLVSPAADLYRIDLP